MQGFLVHGADPKQMQAGPEAAVSYKRNHPGLVVTSTTARLKFKF